jgi:hypothetical protein
LGWTFAGSRSVRRVLILITAYWKLLDPGKAFSTVFHFPDITLFDCGGARIFVNLPASSGTGSEADTRYTIFHLQKCLLVQVITVSVNGRGKSKYKSSERFVNLLSKQVYRFFTNTAIIVCTDAVKMSRDILLNG